MSSVFPEVDAVEFSKALAEGEVIIFLVRLEAFRERLPLKLSTLSSIEKDRYARFHDPEDAWAFYAGRRFLRATLGKILSVESVEIELGPKGKPFCAHPDSPCFNLSHGGGWLLIGFCQDAPIGVDVEDLRRELPFIALAKRFFSAEEQLGVAQEGRNAFFRIWTRKEACLKAGGEGLTVKISDLCTTQGNWYFYELQPDTNTLAVVATRGETRHHRLIRM